MHRVSGPVHKPGNNEVRGALEYAVWNFLKRDAKVTYFGYANSDRIEGRRVQLTNPDKSKTFASIYMHQNRVYITEATVLAMLRRRRSSISRWDSWTRTASGCATPRSTRTRTPAPARIPGGLNRPMGCE